MSDVPPNGKAAENKAKQNAQAELGHPSAAHDVRRAVSHQSRVEDVHQQYPAKHPYGYRCHANTRVRFPETN
jgi:peptide methionine sulfoxide reductase MsrA